VTTRTKKAARSPRASVADAAAADLPLPVLGGAEAATKRPIRRSKMGRRRAAVLIGVHLLILAHIAHWLIAGRTLSPVEPSEAMYTLEQGLVNAGFIFFTLALLSTVLFGRYFCGWGCHVVALQDLCGWMMKKIGVRPKPFRSRLLIYAPLLLGLYMFVWPTVKRIAVAPLLREAEWTGALAVLGEPAPFPGFSAHLTKTEFWETFPGWAVAVPFLFICGFVTVYFLGAKGFCTYGCPYGGFFAPLDKLSPTRVKVDPEACEQTGHCTAVCTSNVRVHEEIREYGMVVDPGCMKCMDCVSVCPNDALSVGLARPAVRKEAPANEAPARKYDLSLREEFAIGGVFLLSFLALRGLYGVVPMLLAGGAAACVAFIAWKTWRVLRDENVRIIGAQLKLKGRVRPAGVAFLAAGAATLGLAGHSFLVQASKWRGDLADAAVTAPRSVVLTGRFDAVSEGDREAAREALVWLTRASSWRQGGLGLRSTPGLDVRIAWLHLVRGETEAAAEALGRAITEDVSDGLAADYARALALDGRADEGAAFLAKRLEVRPASRALLSEYTRQTAAQGRPEAALAAYERGVEAEEDPRRRAALRADAAAALLSLGRMDDGVEALRQAAEEAPQQASIHNDLAVALFLNGERAEAVEAMRRSAELAPESAEARLRLAQMLRQMGREEEARRALQEAARLDPGILDSGRAARQSGGGSR